MLLISMHHLELQISIDEVWKFEKLHYQSGSLAEYDEKKAIEFDILPEEAKLSVNGMG